MSKLKKQYESMSKGELLKAILDLKLEKPYHKNISIMQQVYDAKVG